jgi:hypothetical protein
MKLPAYKQDETLATKVGQREKEDLFRKYNVVNYTLYRFKIDKVIPSPIKNQEQFKQVKNTIPDKELDKMLHDSYTLLQEVGGVYVPYKLKADNGKLFTPTFNSSDLIFVPKDSTGFTVTANVSASYFTGNGSQLTGIRSFSNVFISGQNPVQADSISDTLTLVAGSGITITTDAANDSVTFTTVSTLGAFGADGEFGLVTDSVLISEDLGDLASTNSTTYDLGALVAASGLIYPDQLVLPIYATASLPSASVDAQLVYDSTAGALKYTTGSNWTTVLDGTGNTIVTGNVTATGGWGGTLSSAGVLGGVPMAFFAERTSTGTAGGVMAHGNGSTTGKGLRMPYAGKLIAGTMFGANVNGTITIDAYLNGTANTSYRFSQTGALTDVGETQNWSSAPLTFAAGDTLGWYQTAVPTTANAYTVTFFVTYN